MDSLTRANDITTVISYARTNDLVNQHDLVGNIVDIYHQRIENDENFYPTRNNMDDIIIQAYNRKMNENRVSAGLLSQTSQDYEEIL